ncbi:hypothetical protein [Thiohalophilus sp.]|uniref:hypothetical protein n=1 Tax=Thiohalophilus sp. TaxID=3028392 RepID=UPI002ACD72D0|nr:hypothetical protein [Thiohalophilus sp.]MDZ7804949.1 hypothetical protein [Thiohalophilus sp.]
MVDVTPLVVGAAQPKLTASALASLIIVYSPDYEERKAIQEYICEKENEFRHLMNKAVYAIELLKEHRTALITEAVTGKIDVRDWQKPKQQSQQTAKTATG